MCSRWTVPTVHFTPPPPATTAAPFSVSLRRNGVWRHCIGDSLWRRDQPGVNGRERAFTRFTLGWWRCRTGLKAFSVRRTVTRRYFHFMPGGHILRCGGVGRSSTLLARHSTHAAWRGPAKTRARARTRARWVLLPTNTSPSIPHLYSPTYYHATITSCGTFPAFMLVP